MVHVNVMVHLLLFIYVIAQQRGRAELSHVGGAHDIK